MTSNEILKADILDILFDNRNKQYGAYALRKTYNGRMAVALGVSLSSILLLFFLMQINKPSRRPIVPGGREQVTLTTVELPKDIKKPDPVIPKKSEPQPQVRTEKLTTIDITDDKLADDVIPDMRDLDKGNISNVKTDGIDADNTVKPKEQVILKEVKEDPKPDPETLPVQKEPEFPGGQAAWLNFLQKYLIAPGELEPGEKKNVAIRFQVSAEGIVTNFEIVQSAGSAFDNEVIRVLRKMPKWKPAIQNGQPVARAFTQPVTFMGVEQ
ncbi:MAG TPA: TonB family protein [Flavisolibacter sp.]|jgi:protein TonB|nr:TonB family protein [Flavisolibacter sp.]